MEKNVSKVLSLLMSVVMLVGILSVPMTFTAAEPVQLSLGSAKGAAGDIVTIPFTISANSAAVIGQFKLSYDINRLEYLDSEYGDLLDEDRDLISLVSNVANRSIAFGFRYGESSGITGEGALVTFRFKINTDLTAPVNLTLDFDTGAHELLGWGNTIIPHAFNNGAVSPLGYAITFNFNDGTDPITVWVNEGEKPTPPDHTRVGYSLNRWSPATFVAAHEDATYIAYWSVHYYSVIYAGNGNDGPSTASSSHTYNQEKALALNEFTKTGYAFVGWNTKQDGTGTSFADGQIVKNLSAEQGGNFKLYAQWAINSFDLTYDANGGTGGTGPIATEYGATLTAPIVTREGYTFMGWSPEVAVTMPAADTTYTAQWKAKTYDITFNANGGEGSETQTVEHGTRPDAPVVAREGYTFNGWGVEIDPATEDKTYTAQWTINKYTISFDSNGGTAVADITEDFATVITPPADPTREGYIFNGWSPAVPATMPAENLECTAQWKMVTFKITFDANGGDFGELEKYEQTVVYGTVPTAPAPTREGYTFKGWAPARVAAIADQTYTAKWEIIEYTIFFDANGGEGSETQTVKYGEMPLAPEVTMDGFTFIEWAPAIVTATEDTTYTAIWGDTITINFRTLGGSKVASISGAAGTPITAPEDPTKKGEQFMGWLPSIPENFPAKEDTILEKGVVEIIAVWKESTVFIHFNTLGGTWIPSIAGQPGELVTSIPTAPVKEGYIFKGWFPCVPKVFPEPIALQGNNFFITAIWEKVKTDDVTPEDKPPAEDTPTDEVPDTGSTATGIAAFATLSMAAAAAFVLGKKKED